MTHEQILEAIAQMKWHCKLRMSQQNWEVVSARGILHDLGYHGEQCEAVLKALHENGFDYCLDHRYKCSDGSGDGTKVYPIQDVCYWSPDQLESRLRSVYFRNNVA